ncbi:MAG TPA: glycosyltransferase family 2 protein [Myxococcales bacterium]|nr:glycosyltransferase family 2 protein [Myxococcales bacterium]
MAFIVGTAVLASLGLLGLSYVAYPLALVVLDAAAQLSGNVRRLRRGVDRRRTRELPLPPTVSMVVAAHDEEAVLRQKLENCLALQHPRDRLEILVGSDGSTDGTEAIARAYAFRGVVLSSAPRAGKASVLNRLVPLARGEIVVLSDANTFLAKDALRRLLVHFEDPAVGAVCGQLKLHGAGEESAYWLYESLVKLYEGKLGCVLGANGGLYAVRRRLYRPLPADTITDDFVIPMRLLASGHRVVYEPAAVAFEEAGATAAEFKRRARIGAGNLQALGFLRALWRGPRRGVAAAFLFHKLVRWLGPLWLTVALAGSLVLWSSPFFRGVLLVQLACYAAALWGSRPHPGRLGRACALAHHFVAMNVALAVGAWRYLRGAQSAAWERTRAVSGYGRG